MQVDGIRTVVLPHWKMQVLVLKTTIAANILIHSIGAFNETAFLHYENAPDNVLTSSFMPKEMGFHPTQKPIKLMQALIALTTQERHIVLDPFCGSGSTLLAAKLLNRHYIGFEANKGYADMAKKRLDNNELEPI